MAKPTAFTGMSEVVAVDGKDLNEWGFNLSERPAMLGPPARLTTGVRPGVHGELKWRRRWGMRPIVLRGDVLGDTHAGFVANLEGLRNLFQRDREVILELDDTTVSQQMRCHVQGFRDPALVRQWRNAIYGRGAEIELVALDPFWRAPAETAYNVAGATGTFQALTVGSADSEPTVAALFTGSLTTFTISTGEMAFLGSFDWDYKARNVLGDSITGTTAGNPAFQNDSYGASLRIQRSGTDSLSFTVPGNKAAGAFVWVGRPNWTDGADAQFSNSATTLPFYLFQWYGDANNYAYLRFIPTYVATTVNQAGVWQLLVRANGQELWAQSVLQTFEKGDQLVIGGSWGSTGIHLYLTRNGTKQLASLSETTGTAGESLNSTLSARDVTSAVAMTTNPATLYVGSRQALDGQSDSYHDEFFLWTRQPGDDEMKAFMVDPEAVKRGGVGIDKATVAQAVEANDQIILDAEHQTLKWWDDSADVVKNAIDKLTGVIPVVGPGRSVLYVSAGSANMTLNVRYRRRWL